MKRATAIKNLNNIIKKIRSVNGIYATPLCNEEFLKIKRVWVFGSVAKGSDLPNDLDIFVETLSFKDSRQPIRKGRQKMYRTTDSHRKLHGGYKMDKSTRNRSVPSSVSSKSELCKWLRAGAQKISIHFVGEDEIFETLDCKCLVYPRNDFEEIESHGND